MGVALGYTKDSPNPGLDSPSFVTNIRDRTRSAISRRKEPVMISSNDHLRDIATSPVPMKRTASKRNSNVSSISARRMKSILYKRIRKGSTSTPLRASSVRSTYGSIREKPLFNNDGDIPPPLPPKSPELLVRRRSLHSRSRTSNPVRRLFNRLFRIRSRSALRAKHSYSKAELRRQLSFEVPGYQRKNGTNYLQYEVQRRDLLGLSPKVRRPQTNLKTKIGDPTNPIHVNASADGERPLSPQVIRPLLLNPKLNSQSDENKPPVTATQKFQAKHKRPNLSLPRAKKPENRSSIPEPEPALEEYAPATEPGDVSGDTVGTSLLNPPSGNLSRGNSIRKDRNRHEIMLSREATVRRSATRASRRGNVPIIKRVDLYGKENPTVLIRSKGSIKRDAFDDPNTVDDAMAFVNTWSGYLRQAIAVRIKLQQEIRDWETQEEAEWKRSLETDDSDVQDDDFRSLSSRSSMESLVTNASSDGSEYEQVQSANSRRSSIGSSQVGGSMLDTEQALTAKLTRPMSSESENLEYMYRLERPPSNFTFRDLFRDSFDPNRVSSRYSLLIGDRGSPKEDDEVSDSSYGSISKPEHEASWLSRKSRSTKGVVEGRSVSESMTHAPRPLPDIPQSSNRSASSPSQIAQISSVSPKLDVTRTRESDESNMNGEEKSRPSSTESQSDPMRNWAVDDSTRTWSDKILKDMYSELGELQQQSSELSALISSASTPSSDEISSGSKFSAPQRESQKDSPSLPHSLGSRALPTPPQSTDLSSSSRLASQSLVTRSVQSFYETPASAREIPSALGFHDTSSEKRSSSHGSSASSNGITRGGANMRRLRRKSHMRNISVDSAWRSTDSDSSSITSFRNVGLAIIA